MDERTLEAATATTQRYEADACEHVKNGIKTYRVVVLGREPLTIEAANAEQRGVKMAAAGIDLIEDKWAAGYYDGNFEGNRRFQICGNHVDAREELRKLLRRR